MNVCAKRAYINKGEAKAALAWTQSSPSPRRQEIRFYRCPNCKMYHLTSHETR